MGRPRGAPHNGYRPPFHPRELGVHVAGSDAPHKIRVLDITAALTQRLRTSRAASDNTAQFAEVTVLGQVGCTLKREPSQQSSQQGPSDGTHSDGEIVNDAGRNVEREDRSTGVEIIACNAGHKAMPL